MNEKIIKRWAEWASDEFGVSKEFARELIVKFTQRAQYDGWPEGAGTCTDLEKMRSLIRSNLGPAK